MPVFRNFSHSFVFLGVRLTQAIALAFSLGAVENVNGLLPRLPEKPQAGVVDVDMEPAALRLMAGVAQTQSFIKDGSPVLPPDALTAAGAETGAGFEAGGTKFPVIEQDAV